MKQLATTICQPVSMLNDMDHLFNRLFHTTVPPVQSFRTDIVETDEGYRIQAELPGFHADNTDVRIEDNILVIEATTPESVTETVKDNTTWFVRERIQGSRKRSFSLPNNVDKGSIKAELKNGVLTVELNKSPEAKSFSIKVKG